MRQSCAMIHRRLRRSFTLVELLMSVAIVAMLAATALFTMYAVMESAREVRTRSQITRIHTLIMEKLEAYKTRAIPLAAIPNGALVTAAGTTNTRALSWIRLILLREIMRMELPDIISDLDLSRASFPAAVPAALPPGFNGWGTTRVALIGGTTAVPLISMSDPALWRSYRRAAGIAAINGRPPASWTVEHERAECLYLIIDAMRDGDKSAVEFFTTDEIGDVDADGRNEILDAWGRPILFFRWAPGFTYYWGADGVWGAPAADDNGWGGTNDILERGLGSNDDELVSEAQTINATISPDPFDLQKTDFRWGNVISPGVPQTSDEPFSLIPLIVSAGRDGIFELEGPDASFASSAISTHYLVSAGVTANAVLNISTGAQCFGNDPYLVHASGFQVAVPHDVVGPQGSPNPDGVLGSTDNVTNHLMTTR